MNIYVTLDINAEPDQYQKLAAHRGKIRLGPYSKLMRGYQGEIWGQKAGTNSLDDTEYVFEATVGNGGYCETCAYDYPDYSYSDRDQRVTNQYRRYEIKDFEITMEV